MFRFILRNRLGFSLFNYTGERFRGRYIICLDGWINLYLQKKFYAEVLIAKLINRYTPRISLIVFGGRV